MLVIADASPFIALVKIGQADVLQKLFQTVTIPVAVADELKDANRPQAVRDFIAMKPAWIAIRIPSKVENIPKLHKGECQAISLAQELKADLLLIDDNAGHQAAIARHIPTTRTAALLRDAANRGFIKNLKETFDLLKATNFRVAASTLDGLLQQHEEFKRQQTP